MDFGEGKYAGAAKAADGEGIKILKMPSLPLFGDKPALLPCAVLILILRLVGLLGVNAGAAADSCTLANGLLLLAVVAVAAVAAALSVQCAS